MKRHLIVLSFAAIAVVNLSGASEPALASGPHATPARVCGTKDLKLSIQGANGEFSGMSHDGFNAVLTNVSKDACALDPHPRLSFDNAAHEPVAIVPAPATIPANVSPLTLKPHAAASSTAGWVSSDAYDTNHCADASELVYSFPQVLSRTGEPLPLLAKVRVHACGPAAPAKITFTAGLWQIMATSPAR